jgi:Fe-S-cluster containining protein
VKNRPRLPDPVANLRRDALEEVRAIYRELETRPIHRACTRLTECCQFKLTGRTPQLTKGEALLAARALRASGRKAMSPRQDGACPLLRENGACMIYQDRPFGCRTHFCAAAGGPYARGEVLDLIRRLEAVDSRLGGSGPRALPGAVADELRAVEG